ncbi:MAG TPA: PD-(D/E)XK nuclease family protein [Candidatus Saccharimonadales bacterium]|nr:PD-(D/E)XK nuclease family protein [Candidatus Saccharimonadales bacterium]
MANNYWRERSVPYKPGQKTAYKLSRSKIELFMQCPRCFWLDARLKIKRPDGPPFNINKAIDELFKREFDSYRTKGEPHPIMVENNVAAIPFMHEKLDDWRENFVGVQYVHEPTNLLLFGAVDDLWVTEDGQVIVVDYKATAKDKEVSISAGWQISYKRQMEIYQWLLRQNGFDVQSTGYFVYTNGRFDVDIDGFFNKLEFKTKLIPYTGDDGWVEPIIYKMKECMDGEMPQIGDSIMGGPCDFCTYARARTELTLNHLMKKGK